jgi:cytochrome c-type biogenesis protein CcmH/NrfG
MSIRSPPPQSSRRASCSLICCSKLNQPGAALTEYRAVLHTDPNRFRSLLGEARAAKQAGDAAVAHGAYEKLVALSKPAGPERPEVAEAKAYLTN